MSPVMELLASVGLGSARVDTRLKQRAVVAGEELHGTIEVFGGDVDQAIQHVELRLELRSWMNLDSHPDKVRVQLAERLVQPGFTAKAGQRLSLPFVFPIPEDTPMSFGPSRVDLLTALSVDWAIDPRDQDPIDIQPGPLAERTHQALRVLGFELSRASLVMWRNGTWRQEVVFRPAVEPWTSRLDEVGLVFIPGALRIEIWLEIDRASLTSRPPGDGDRIGLDWPREAFPADPEQIAAELDRTLRQYTAEG